MADEPRRSGRATKGQHKQDRDAVEDASPPKKKGRGRVSKAAKAAEEEEEDDPKDDYVRCVCGEYEEEEDIARSMICCDTCSAWQHNMCMGLPEDYAPAKYYCEQCRPKDHKDLLAAIARGEQPWVEALKRAKAAQAEEKSQKKKGKKGRKSGGAVARTATPTPAPVHESEPAHAPAPAPVPPLVEDVEEPVKVTGQKRKAEGTPPAEVKNKKVRGTPAAENGTSDATQIRKASTPTVEPAKSEPVQDGVVSDPKELTNGTRKGAADNFIKLFTAQIKEAVKAGKYSTPTGSSPQDAGIRLGLQVEHALYNIIQQGAGEPGDAYKAQLRAISFNIKKNPALGQRVVTNSLSPQELASMDPKDMASEEQQRKDAALKEELDKQHTIIHEQGPRIRRTHKGEEYVDEANQVAAESTTSKAPVRKQSTIDQGGDIKSPTGEDKSTRGRQPLSVNTQSKSRPAADPRRKSSSNFDIDKVWSGVQGSPDGETPRMSEAPQRESPPPMGAGGDPDIDNLLKDEENESEPYSPKDFNEEGIVWRGSVNGGSLGKFRTTAKFAAGAKPDADTLRLTWEKVIPAEVVIHGRIQPQKADDYLCGLEYSSTSDLIIVHMAEPRNREDIEGFDKLFKYFKVKSRYGVGVQHENPAIKDIYLLPMDAGQPLPTFIKAIETDFPDPVPERMFLVPIVIKNSELPHNMNAAGQATIMSPSLGPPVAQTPITPQEGRGDMGQPQNGGYSYGQPPNGTPQPSVQQSPSVPQGGWSAPQQSPAPSTPSMPPNPSPALSAAYRILGPQLANSSAVQQLLRSAPNVGDTEMKIVHDCIKENGQAAHDLGVLTRMLQLKSLQSKENQAQAQAQISSQAQPQGQQEIVRDDGSNAPGGAQSLGQSSSA